MRSIVLSILLILVAVHIPAQSPASSSPEPDLEVLQKKWRVDYKNKALERDIVSEAAERAREDAQRREIERMNEILREQGMPTKDIPVRPLRRDTGRPGNTVAYTYSVKLRNRGKIGIRAIEWEYVFLDPGTKEELGRRRFSSKSTIGPGRTKSLVVRSTIPPTGTIDAGNVNQKREDRYLEQIVIVGVVYADGSRWPA
ncbi:MAG: hypothetical protein IPM25_06860 [Chloracidobacterium sp.]|nr:hypothetical protein [Chloracidobacterium sp.]